MKSKRAAFWMEWPELERKEKRRPLVDSDQSQRSKDAAARIEKDKSVRRL
jgi:hypothetical protein